MSRQVTTSNHKPTFHSEIDTDALAEKYRAERGKRIRGEGIDQYRTIDELAIHHYITDVWTELGFTREPVAKTTDVLVIGGGFGGQLIAARLQGVGITNILIIDKAADFGGAWYWNRYPGLSCDIESYIYLPLLEEMDYMPTEKYAKGAEILAYAQEIGQKFDLYSKALFQAEVTALEWDDSESRWTGSTNWGDKIYAKFVAIAGGPMHSPKLPGIPGIERFKGHGFHTSRWDYSYTGGNDQGSLNKLRDKRVGVIGTGKTTSTMISTSMVLILTARILCHPGDTTSRFEFEETIRLSKNPVLCQRST
jgi:cyclohexanone monooxygenase